MRKLIAVLAMVVATIALAARPASAQQARCTDSYVQCLNDSYQLKGALRLLADIECFADYVGCVAAGVLRS